MVYACPVVPGAARYDPLIREVYCTIRAHYSVGIAHGYSGARLRPLGFDASRVTRALVCRNFRGTPDSVFEVIPKRSPNLRYTLIGALNSWVPAI